MGQSVTIPNEPLAICALNLTDVAWSPVGVVVEWF